MSDPVALLRKHRPPEFVEAFLEKYDDPNELRVAIDHEIHGTALVAITDKVNFPAGPYRCRKCHSDRVLCRNVQARSIDEGMTSFFLCECGFAFKE